MAIQSAENKKFHNKDDFNQHSNNFNSNNFANKTKNNQKKCSLCSENHFIAECKQFLSKASVECFEIAKNKKLCINCLSNSHAKRECKSAFNCKKCKARHHTLLHFDNKTTQVREIASNVSEIQKSTDNISYSITRNDNFAMLATAMAGVLTKSGEKVIMRILVDMGSQAAYISENALQTLKLPKQKMLARSIGIGENPALSKYVVSLQLIPIFDSSFVLSTQAVVLKKITNYAPDLTNSSYSFDNFKNLRLADPNFKLPSNVDIIIGCAEHAQIIKPGLVKGAPNEPIAQDTEFGWIISGPVALQSERPKDKSLH